MVKPDQDTVAGGHTCGSWELEKTDIFHRDLWDQMESWLYGTADTAMAHKLDVLSLLPQGPSVERLVAPQTHCPPAVMCLSIKFFFCVFVKIFCWRKKKIKKQPQFTWDCFYFPSPGLHNSKMFTAVELIQGRSSGSGQRRAGVSSVPAGPQVRGRRLQARDTTNDGASSGARPARWNWPWPRHDPGTSVGWPACRLAGGGGERGLHSARATGSLPSRIVPSITPTVGGSNI